MSHSYLTAKAEVRPAGHKGMGVFATQPVAAGETIAAFGGTICDKATFSALPEHRQIHAIQIDDELYMVGPEVPDPADMANHSCEPNAGIVGNILLAAMSDIAIDEEICFDYAMCDAADYDEFICACGAPSCRNVVTSADWRRPELQARYRGWMSSYLARRIAAEAPTTHPVERE